MNIVLRVIIDIFILGGYFFALAGAVGIVRMPDTFSRMQSSTNITTLGVLLTLIGALLYCIFVMHLSLIHIWPRLAGHCIRNSVEKEK